MRDRAAVLEWLAQAPPEAAVLAAALAEALREFGAEPGNRPAISTPLEAPAPPSWPERLWTVPDRTRLTVADVAKALDKTPNAIHKLTARAAKEQQKQQDDPDYTMDPTVIPCRRAHDGTWSFVAGELRQWKEQTDEIVARPPAPFGERLRVSGN